jgi:hypothetical protein
MKLLPASIIFALCAAVLPAGADSISSQPPINYATAKSSDPIALLQAKLDAGKAHLTRDDRHGYLESVLANLGIPVSSQTLVFSKTSFQRDLIAPWKPRALYFNDNTYIGWVQGGEVLEVASVDRHLGPVFYALDQHGDAEKPRFRRQNDNCLQCHEGNMTQNVPGLMVRSVYPDASGMPLFSAGTFRTTESSPFKERWGGWYVTGTCGSMRHMGNLLLRKNADPDSLDLDAGANLTDLSAKFDVSPYLRPSSDVVALLVLTHQAQVHNLLTKAGYETRLALRDQDAMNKALGEKPDHTFDSTQRRIKSACEPLLKAMLFCDTQPLPEPITGDTAFVHDFTAVGPRDPSGRSLRDLDLHGRVFKYPCSFLIYTDQFANLPRPAKTWLYTRLHEILTGADSSNDFAHLSPEDRKDVREILTATVKDLNWR